MKGKKRKEDDHDGCYLGAHIVIPVCLDRTYREKRSWWVRENLKKFTSDQFCLMWEHHSQVEISGDF